MARYVTRVRTPWSASDAFGYMADMRNFAEWDPGISEVVQRHGDAPGVGAAYDVTISTAGPDQTMHYRTVEHDPPTDVLFVSQSSIIESIDRISVTPTSEHSGSTGCFVTYDAELNLQGVMRIAGPVLSVLFQRIGDRAAAGLRSALDGEDAT